VITNFNADSEGITPDVIVQKLIECTPANEEALSKDEKLETTFKS
jgi:hypothetical protein